MDEVLQLCHLLLRGIRAPLLAKSNNCKTGKKERKHCRVSKQNRETQKNSKAKWKTLTHIVYAWNTKKTEEENAEVSWGVPAVTKRRLYCMRLWARPVGFFFLSCFATFGVWPRTFPARANDPCTLPAPPPHTWNAWWFKTPQPPKTHRPGYQLPREYRLVDKGQGIRDAHKYQLRRTKNTHTTARLPTGKRRRRRESHYRYYDPLESLHSELTDGRKTGTKTRVEEANPTLSILRTWCRRTV